MTGFRTQFAVLAARHVPFPRRTLKTETSNRHLLLCDRSSRPPHLHSCATLLAACRHASSSTCSASGPITAQAAPTLPFTTSGCILAYRGELHSRHHFPIGSYELPLSNTTAACRCPSYRPHVLISLSSLIAHRSSRILAVVHCAPRHFPAPASLATRPKRRSQTIQTDSHEVRTAPAVHISRFRHIFPAAASRQVQLTCPPPP
jgi:hypothetical protein